MANIPILDGCTLFGPWPQHPADLAVESLLAVMAQNGVVRSLATATTGIFYDYRQGNAETLEAARKHPQQLFPVATLDPRVYPEALDEADARAAEGFRLFRFFPERQGWPLRYAPFRELLQKCDELKVPVAVTTSRPGDVTELADAVAFTAAPLLLAGVGPATLGEAIAIMKSDPKFYLETTALLSPGALEAVRDTVPDGIERLVFSSYSPLRYLSTALHPIMYSGLTEAEKTLVLGGNL
ncbi:MAG TPA: amidohydrolase family protein, partial [Abditibacteriaceae bacterium]